VPGGPSSECRFAGGVVSVTIREETIFEHGTALIGDEELEAEIRIACGAGLVRGVLSEVHRRTEYETLVCAEVDLRLQGAGFVEICRKQHFGGRIPEPQ
jgi:hypothetical protein